MKCYQWLYAHSIVNSTTTIDDKDDMVNVPQTNLVLILNLDTTDAFMAFAKPSRMAFFREDHTVLHYTTPNTSLM